MLLRDLRWDLLASIRDTFDTFDTLSGNGKNIRASQNTVS